MREIFIHDSAEQWLVSQLRFDRAADLALPTSLGWDDVAHAAQRTGLASICLARWEGHLNLPASARADLQRARYRIVVDNALHLNELKIWLDRFEGVHIPALALKGPALAATVYGEDTLRPMTDIDLLVPRADFNRAAEMLRESGFAPVRDLGAGKTLRTQTIWWRAAHPQAAIHLHWHLIDSGFYARWVPIEWFWDHTMDASLKGRTMRVLSPEAQLIYLTAHLQLHHAGNSVLRVYDVAALVHEFGGALDWEMALAAAERFKWNQSLRLTLELAQALFGVSIPPAIQACLRRVKPTLRERVALALAEDAVHPAAFFLDGWDQPGWKAKLGYWSRTFFPAREFMRERHGSQGLPGLVVQYVLRLGRGLYRIPSALVAGLKFFRRAEE